ncbi:non-ribosomal peptide synthetase [Aestuariispira insulae]|uniref:Amino acid adenylation domain-containing protein n=1 Tax=Aestuariispira insulae TaxID=1461337 RepID=A0A3D9H8L7_9PROT|nr:non-ribosomal peptide synthetase [Aestuariispira insulae]RED45828.1 amino acid adenylation domain-containing protein [Aestuariispira insulae]
MQNKFSDGTDAQNVIIAQDLISSSQLKDGDAPGGQPETVLSHIAEIAASAPDRPALVCRNREISYRTLIHSSALIAAAIHQHQIAQGDFVAICMNRSPDMVMASLAVMRAGAAYIPLSPDYPVDRLCYMLRDSGPKMILCDDENLDHVTNLIDQAGQSIPVKTLAALEKTGDDIAQEPSGEWHDPSASDLAYVIYTSGSTGQPKGVMIEHGGLANLARAQADLFHMTKEARVLQFAPFSFDASVSEIFVTLASGAALCFEDPDQILAGEALIEALTAFRISHVTLPPAVLARLDDCHGFETVKVLVTAGEAPSWPMVRRWSEGRTYINAYGPTESTVCATAIQLGPDEDQNGPVPIGYPMAGIDILLLDDHLVPVSKGQQGRIWIGGAGLARGYLNRPDLTADRFHTIPGHQGRYYDSGDLGRLGENGRLEYLGRDDDQVKIRGFRVECSEVENTVLALEQVRAAVVTALRSASGENRLICHFTPAIGHNADRESLTAILRKTLPDFMIPSAFIAMDRLPTSPSGKIDRKRLPEPARVDFGTNDFLVPNAGLESEIADIWRTVTGLDQVGRNDTLASLGGNSLDAVQFLTRIRNRFGPVLQLREIFQGITVGDITQKIEKHSTVESAHLRELIEFDAFKEHDCYPLSRQQSGVWLLEQLAPNSLAYNAQCVIRIRGNLDKNRLQQALDEVVARHDIFRTSFHMDEDGNPFQKVHASAPASLTERPLEQNGGDMEAALQAAVSEEVSKPFTLDQLPLVRWVLFRLTATDHALLHIEHHFVHDGWSANLFLKEMLAIYDRIGDGAPADRALVTPPAQYRHYVAWQKSDAAKATYQRQLDFWCTKLEGAPTRLDMLTDFPRPARMSFNGRQIRHEMPVDLFHRLSDFCARENVTLYSALMAAFQILLAQQAGQQDFLIGSAVANRKSSASEEMIGMFVNSVVIRSDLPGAASFRDLLSRVVGTVADAYDNEELPFEEIVHTLQPDRTPDRNPMFQVGFSFHNSDLPELKRDDFDLSLFEAYSNNSCKFDFEIVMLPRAAARQESQGDASTITFLWNYATDLFREETMRGMLDRYLKLLDRCLRDPAQPVASLQSPTPDEIQEMIQNWAAKATHPEGKLLHQPFEEMAKLQPDRTALRLDGGTLDYQSLETQASQLAKALQDRDIGPGDKVGLCMDRSFDLIIAMLAILKSGAAYLPIDPAIPQHRMAFILDDAKPAAVLCDATGRKQLDQIAAGNSILTLLDIADTRREGAVQPLDSLAPVDIRPDSLAYIIYTSGSTGKPKGVMIEHRQAARLFDSCRAHFDFGPDDVWTLFHSYAFDFSVWEIFGAVGHGGTLIIVPKETTRSPDRFYRLCCQEKVSILNQTPSAFRAFMAAQREAGAEHSLREVIFGGEGLDAGMLVPWYGEAANRNCRLVNMYGITEITVHATFLALSPEYCRQKTTGSPIGRPLDDLSFYILDEDLKPVLPGRAGEIHIGGAGVARGYLNRPDLNQARFIANPHHPQERLYKTGDLARYLADGTIEYLGRNDDQVKIRGYRIELGEIENRVSTHPDVANCVTSTHDLPDGTRMLVAYCIIPEGASFPERSELEQHLAAFLPDYMIPAAFIEIDQIPLTTNGKLDRKALPSPEMPRNIQTDHQPPQTKEEEILASVWSTILEREAIGRTDHFFELGGHSLLAVRVQASLRKAGYQVDAASLLTHPVLEKQALHLRPLTGASDPEPGQHIAPTGVISPKDLDLVFLEQADLDQIGQMVPGGLENVADIYPLTPLQEGILFHHQISRDSDPYLLWHLNRFDSRQDLDRYLTALQKVIQRHDILRTAFIWQGLHMPIQVVLRQVTLSVETVSIPPATDDPRAYLIDHYGSRQNLMDLTQAPLLRIYLAPEGDGWLALMQFHHLIDDNSSLKQMQSEILTDLEGDFDRLPPALPFRNYVALAADPAEKERHRRYFETLLSDFETPTIPFGQSDIYDDGGSVTERRLHLEDELAGRIYQTCRSYRASPAALFHMAWAQVMAQTSGQLDVVFGTVLFGRLQGMAGAERILGPFINTLPFRVRLDETPAARMLTEVQDQLSQLLQHEAASLAQAQQCSEIRAPLPLFASLLNYRHSDRMEQTDTNRDIRNLPGSRFLGAEERSNYPLMLAVDDSRDGFRVTLQARSGIDADLVMNSLLERLQEMTRELDKPTEAPACRIRLPENTLAQPQHPAIPILNRVSEQAGLTPDKTAISAPDGCFTYGELERYSDQLAGLLKKSGFGSRSKAAICLPRTRWIPVALLAVMKAGGCFIPLDPAHPEQRLAQALADSRPDQIICDQLSVETANRANALAGQPAQTTDLSAHDLSGRESFSPRAAATDDPAYIIYTSGSTGTPKGVVIPNSALSNYVQGLATGEPLNETDKVLCTTSLSFDISFREIFWPLTEGASLVIAETANLLDPGRLSDLIRGESITHCQFVPSLLRHFLEDGSAGTCTSLQQVDSGGEALPVALARIFHQQLPFARLINHYGPTEATIYCCWHEVTAESLVSEEEGAIVSIGSAQYGNAVHILDDYGNILPAGVEGELCIAGPGLAIGYHNRPDLTDQAFQQRGGLRIYRTGDRAIGNPDGSFRYRGREDHQLKIRGYRIEAGEIEYQLEQHDDIRQAIATAHPDASGNQQLIAYFLPEDQAMVPDGQALRQHLEQCLPPYMVPGHFIRLESIPLTRNGKLDRSALPAPGYREEITARPETALEIAVAEIWCGLLDLDQIGLDDSFFDCGGHSLLAARMTAQIRDLLGAEIPLRSFFERPTIRGLLDHIFGEIDAEAAS